MSYAPQQRPNLPSRTGPVILIVAGAIAMILGPIIGVVMSVSTLMGSVDWQDFANSQQISNGSSVDLPAGSEWTVVPENVSQGYSCDVTREGNELVDTGSREGIVFFTAEEAGSYTIACDPAGGTLVLMPGENLDELIANAPGAFSPVAVGFLVGFLGFISLVVGIIWLVRVNRDRRAAGGGGGYPPPGGYGGYGPGGYGPGNYGQGPQPGDPYAPTSPGPQWQQPPGQQPWGQPPPGGQQDPWKPQPRYGQNPTDPPRYGERINPQDPNG